jgi:hypothetical protein
MMNEILHKKRHHQLHEFLDELVADWMRHTNVRLSKNTVLELMKWSNEQCSNPTEEKK